MRSPNSTRLHLLALLIMPLGGLFGQTIEWDIPYPDALRVGRRVVVDGQGDVISGGEGFYLTGFGSRIYLRKQDATGAVIWQDSLQAPAPERMGLSWLGTDDQDHIIVVASRFTLSGQSRFPTGLAVYELDPGGNVLCNTFIPGVIGGQGWNQPLGSGVDALLSDQNELYIGGAGTTDDLNANGEFGLVLIKLDDSCNVLWQRAHAFTNVHRFRAMDMADGRVAVTGSIELTGASNATVMWDEQGNELWSATGTALDQTWAPDVVVLPGGGTCTLAQQYGSPNNTLELTRYDLNGDTVFTRTYAYGHPVTPGRLAVLPGDRLVLAATNWSTSNGTLHVVQVDAQDGAVVASHDLALPQVNNWVYEVLVAPSGNHYVSGKTDNNGGSPASLFVAAFDATTNLLWHDFYSGPAVVPMDMALAVNEDLYLTTETEWRVIKYGGLSTHTDRSRQAAFTLYPNPARDAIMIEGSDLAQRTVTQEVRDALGRLVARGRPAIQDQRLRIEVGDLAPGTYLLTLRTAHGILGSAPFTVE